MAHILEATVEGLAGRSEPYSVIFNRDVNVFFGLNGSGKTTLLKILHSALSTETEILKELPFTRADVKIYLKRYQKVFVRTFKQREQTDAAEVLSAPAVDQASFWGDLPKTFTSNYSFADAQKIFLQATQTVWTSDPPEDTPGLTHYRSGFLPISRLYRNVRTSSGTKRLSDRELDEAFARGLQSQWSDYYADISKETTKVQERGFANILGFFLVGGQEKGEQTEAPDSKEAYKRISGFLRRQPGFAHLLPSEPNFGEIYARRPELRNVVKQIEIVESEIAEISAPRERFRRVLESMFSGSKHLVFKEKEIQVELPEHRQIGLSLLSSGEKQLLFIALHALVGGDNCLMVDEPELSMHVDWQKRLIATLRDLNPRLQLIMATHSPEIMADTPDDKIFKL